MTSGPTKKQALLLWRMIAAESEAERSPLQSKTRPRLQKSELADLVSQGLVTLEPHGRGERLVLTEKAWGWAAEADDVELLKSQSSVGAEALQGLLRRLLPFLRRREIALAELFMSEQAEVEPAEPAPAEPVVDSASLPRRIEEACLALTGGKRKERVRLSALRSTLSSVERGALDHALLQLQDQRRLVLYREDNSAALTPADHEAALSVNGSPRHIVYLEA